MAFLRTHSKVVSELGQNLVLMTPWSALILPYDTASGMRERPPRGAGTSLPISSQGGHTGQTFIHSVNICPLPGPLEADTGLVIMQAVV